jgi:YesN/AraC family two-component response regulator
MKIKEISELLELKPEELGDIYMQNQLTYYVEQLSTRHSNEWLNEHKDFIKKIWYHISQY